MLQQLKNIYRSLPPWVTAPVKYVPNGVLFGKSFRTCEPRTDLDCIGENLKTALDYAREHTVWGREHIPTNIAAVDAEKIVADLPCVTSAELAAEPERFESDEANRFNSYWTTTGETGKNPTKVLLSNSAYGVEWAHMLKIWEMGGYCRKRDVKLTMRGYHFRPGEILRRDPIYNEVGVDPFQLSDENFNSVMDVIDKLGVCCIHGYPTLISTFMDQLRRADRKLKVNEIMLASEGATVELKRELADFFGARVLSWYGLTEKVVLAYDEFATNRFKVFTSYGFPRVDLLNENGVGELVGTTFVNPAMPLVNYCTGDYGRVVKDGSSLVIEDLQGRSGKDFIYESESVKYPVTAINLPGEVQDKILFYQIVQNTYGKILIRVLPKVDRFADDAVTVVKKEVGDRLKNFEVDCCAVKSDKEFERSKRGKLRMLVQEL